MNHTMRIGRLALVSLFLLGGMATLGAAEKEKVVSKYTSTSRKSSISFKEDTGETTAGFKGVFRGLGGYQLIHLSGDERSWINVSYGGKTADLYAETMAAGPGRFSAQGERRRGMARNRKGGRPL